MTRRAGCWIDTPLLVSVDACTRLIVKFIWSVTAYMHLIPVGVHATSLRTDENDKPDLAHSLLLLQDILCSRSSVYFPKRLRSVLWDRALYSLHVSSLRTGPETLS